VQNFQNCINAQIAAQKADVSEETQTYGKLVNLAVTILIGVDFHKCKREIIVLERNPITNDIIITLQAFLAC
jgi:hypothetical protein